MCSNLTHFLHAKTTEVANLATYVNSTLIFLASGSTAIFQSNITEKELDRNTLAEYGWGEGEGHVTTRSTNLNYYVLHDPTQKHRNEVELSR